MLSLSRLTRILKRAERFGSEVRPDGTIIYGLLSEKRLRGWFHVIFPPYDESSLDAFVSDVDSLRGTQLPSLWREFNGCNLFSARLKVYGLRLGVGPKRTWTPFDFAFENNVRPHLREEFYGYIFGSISGVGSELFLIETRTGAVIGIDRETELPIFRWPVLDEFLELQVTFFDGIFDENGVFPETLAADFRRSNMEFLIRGT